MLSYAQATSWLGAKRWVKDALSLRPVNWALVRAARTLPLSPTIARLPVAAAEVFGTVRGLSFVLTDPARCTIAKELFWGRGVRVRADERTSLEVFADLARFADHVLDIGANTGIFALVGARANAAARVHAFEIVPDVFEVLFRNVVRNDLADRIACHLLGVGHEGHVLTVPSFAAASSLPTSVSALDAASAGVHVRFTALDTFAASVPDGARCLLKIDVEGTEDQVFAGGARTLERLRPDILCELLPGGDRGGVVSGALRRLGYSAFKIVDGAIERAATIVPDAHHHDWLFTPRGAEQLARETSVPVR